MARTKVDAMWEDLHNKGYFQKDKATFDKYFYAPGEQGYRNRKALYDDLHAKGYLQSPTYEDFAQRIGLHSTGNGGVNNATNGTGQSMMPADIAERRVRTRNPHPLDRRKAEQQLRQNQRGIDAQQKRWQQDSDRQKQYVERRTSTLPGGMERIEGRAKDQLATGKASPMPIAPNEEVVRGDMVFDDDGRMRQSYQVGSDLYSSRAGAEADLYRQAHPMEDDIAATDTEIEDLDRRIAERTAQLQGGGYGFAASLANVESGNGSPMFNQALLNDPELSMLWSAKRSAEAKRKMIRRDLDGEGFFDVLGNELFSMDTWDFGAQELNDAFSMMIYNDKKFDDSKLDDAQRSMMSNAYAKQVAQQMYGANDTFWQRAGSITAQAIPFVSQFLATGGMSDVLQGGAKLASKAAAKVATNKVLGNRVAQWVIRNAGVAADDMLAAFVMSNTIGGAATAADIASRHQGQMVMGADGTYHFEGGKSWGRSIWEGEVANTLEYYTEMLGNHFGYLSNLAGRGAARFAETGAGRWLAQGADKIGIGKLSQFFNRVKGSEWAQATSHMLRSGGIQDYPSEVLEEEVNLILNSLLVGDNQFSDLVDGKTQLDILGGMLLSIGFMQSPGIVGGSAQAAQYYRYKHATDVADQTARARLGDEKWDVIKGMIDDAKNEDIPAVIESILNDESLPDFGRVAVGNYMSNLIKMRGYNLRTMADAKDKMDEQGQPEDQPADTNAAFHEGYNAPNEQQGEIGERVNTAAQRLISMGYSEADLDRLDQGEYDVVFLNSLPDDQRIAVLDYVNARAELDGTIQHSQDEIENAVAQSDARVDARTNRTSGSIVTATLTDGRQVAITRGNVATVDNGGISEVDDEASDGDLIARDEQTGEIVMIHISDIQQVDDVLDPEQVKAETAENIRQTMAREIAARINGDVQAGGSYDMMDEQGDTMHGTVLELRPNNTAVVQMDGAPQPMVLPTQNVQAWVDNAKARLSVAPSPQPGPAVEQAPQQVNDKAPQVEQSVQQQPLQNNAQQGNAAPAIPIDEQTGEPIWNKTTPEQGYNHLAQSGLNADDITSLVDDRIAQADAAIAKASKGGSINERLAARQSKNYWDAVKKLHDEAIAQAEAMQQPATTETAAEPQPTEQAAAQQAESKPTAEERKAAAEREQTEREEKRRTALKERAARWADFLGVPVEVFETADGIADDAVSDAINKGKAVRAWFFPATGKVGVYLPNIRNGHDMDVQIMHEVVAHHGMRKLFGDAALLKKSAEDRKRYKDNPDMYRRLCEEEYGKFCDRVFDELMTEQEREHFLNYEGVDGDKRAAADEFIAWMINRSGGLRERERTRLQQILDWIRGVVNNLLREVNATADERHELTRSDVMNLLRASMKNLEETRNKAIGREVSTTLDGVIEGRGRNAKRRRRPIRYSVQSIATGGGFRSVEDDGNGNVGFIIGDTMYNGNSPITVDVLKNAERSPLNLIVSQALELGTLKEDQVDKIYSDYAALLNRMLEKGLAKNGGFYNLAGQWRWVAETVFRSVHENADKQYNQSIDITTICKKNEAVINAISEMQREQGYGVTPNQILHLYENTYKAGYQTPCPVCYVFSHYLTNGRHASTIINGWRKFGKMMGNPTKLAPAQYNKRVKYFTEQYNKAVAWNEANKAAIQQAQSDIQQIEDEKENEFDKLAKQILGGKLSKKEEAAARRRIDALDKRYRAAVNLVAQANLDKWIKHFALDIKSKKDFTKNRLREDSWREVPDEMALDFRMTAESLRWNPGVQRLRSGDGSAGGKYIHQASNNELGEVLSMLGLADASRDAPNQWLEASKATTKKDRDSKDKAAMSRFERALKYMRRQSLRGGQRMWSWSDNIEALAPDLYINLLQMQLLNGTLQSYSKQLEGINLVARLGGYVNGSLMGLGKGFREVGKDQVEEIEKGVYRLKNDITEEIHDNRFNRPRTRVLQQTGAAVIEDGGKFYTLVYDDVVGVHPFDVPEMDDDGKPTGRMLSGLFTLNGQLDKAGNILVGMNDMHNRIAMADPNVYFIIPYHKSSLSVHMLTSMYGLLNVEMADRDAMNYEGLQENTFIDEGQEVLEPLRQLWESHKNERDFACGIEGGIPSGANGTLSPQQVEYRALRNAIFMDKDLEVDDERMEKIKADVFLKQVYDAVRGHGDRKPGLMQTDDTRAIYPYEYWDEKSTFDKADINGERYVEYCRRLGVRPKFCGMTANGEMPADEEKRYGNFVDLPGYWKTLIDRRMYDVNGKYQGLTPVDTKGFNVDLVDPMVTKHQFPVTQVADEQGAREIVKATIEQEKGIMGDTVEVDYSQTPDKALKTYQKALGDSKARGVAFSIAEDEEQGEALQYPDNDDAMDGGVRFSVRTKPAPKKTQKVYKLMRLGDDGQLYPLFIDAAEPIELGTWYDADSPNLETLKTLSSDVYTGTRSHEVNGETVTEEYRYGVYLIDNETGEALSLEQFKRAHKGEKGYSRMGNNPNKAAINYATANNMRWVKIEQKNSGQRRYGGEARSYYNYGINGAKNGGAVGLFAMRPGWHAGSLPTMRQIGKGTGKNLRDDRFVWVEGVVSADVDYNAEAQATPDKDIPDRIPEDGFYLKSTNANADAAQADRVGWYVAGAFRPDRVIGDREAREIIDQWNAEHPDDEPVEYDFPRESGRVFNAETMQLEDDNTNPDGPNGGVRFSLGDVKEPERSDLLREYEEGNEINEFANSIAQLKKDYEKGDVEVMRNWVNIYQNSAKYWEGQIKKDSRYFDDDSHFVIGDRARFERDKKLTQYARDLVTDMIQGRKDHTNWQVVRGREISIDDMENLFKNHNEDEYNAELWDRVMAVSRQLGVDNIKFNKTRENVSGRVLGGRVRFDDGYFNDYTESDKKKCEVMLHEMIHHATVYAMNFPEKLTDSQRAAVRELESVYERLKADPTFKGEYGIKNAKEMIAELSNPRFREKLKKKNLWQRVIDGIMRLFSRSNEGVEQTDALSFIRSNLEKLLDDFNKDAYTQFAEEARKYKPRFSLAEGETAAGVTLFSGGGLVEAGLRGIVDPRAAVEFDKKISGVYRDNHGNHIVTADVRDVDPMELAKQVDGPVEYFHASPVCKNFSVLKDGGEKPLDIETAKSTANAIEKMRPRIVTIENVANYQRSDALKVIAEKLDELGYTHDVHIVDAADYGAATHRRRLILRAVAPGNELPAFPKGDKESFTPWFDRVADLISDLPETNMPDWMVRRLVNDGIYWQRIEQPLIVMSSGAAYGGIGHAFADEAAPTIAAGRTGDRIVMPNGKVYKVTGRVLARLMGLNDDYKLPKSESLAHTILGNGVPVELTRGVIGPLVKEVAEPSSPRFSLSEDTQKVFDTAKRKFGETKDIREAGYILPDGTMLDFSGRHELDPGTDSSFLAGRRTTDHRAINQISFVYDENGDEVDTGVNSDMPDFIKRGAIRIDNNAGLINLSTKPTVGQRKVLRQLIAENGGAVDVDFGDGWDTDHHVEYNGVKATRVLGDIDRYFDEGIKPESNARFSLADPFYSNAARAVEGVKQEKAKAEQWKAMLTKAGGIKAGEDKWMGLSTWLDEHKGETLTKDEVRQFVAENGIKMEETHYGDNLSEEQQSRLNGLQNEFNEIKNHIADYYAEEEKKYNSFSNELKRKYGGDYFYTELTDGERAELDRLEDQMHRYNTADHSADDIAFDIVSERYGDGFTIAFDVNIGTLVPQRDADGGHLNAYAQDFIGKGDDANIEPINQTRLKYTTEGLKNKREIAFVVPDIEPYQGYDEVHFGPENQGRAVMWVRFGETTDTEGNRVLVIDEIQSNRHQDAREKGYKNTQERARRVKDIEKEIAEFEKRQKEILEPIINSDKYKGHITQDGESGDYMWDEFWEERKQMPELADIDSRLDELYQEKGRLTHGRFSGIPDAPFEKNWHEVVMKRMLRLAAEEGFDKVAWTTGEQQAERYGLGGMVDKINVEVEDEDFGRWVEFDFHGGSKKSVLVNNDGIIEVGPDDQEDTITDPLHLKDIHDVVGKELGDKILSVGEKDNYVAEFSGDDLRIGGEGMKAFYDKMLPQFMNKYGKRWGVKVGEVTLDTPGEEVMHSVDVNEDMKRSVMQGQPLFSVDDGSPRDVAIARDTYERMLSRGGYQFQEAVQDSMLSLKRLYQAVLGRKTHIEDVADNENAYLAENAMSSINAAEQHEYFSQLMKPLLAAVHALAGKNEKKRQELVDYMMAKHGLERNLVLADRDAQEAAANGGDYNVAYAENRERDYAGLTALTGESDVAAAETIAQQMVDDYERDHDTTELWSRVKAATGATLYKMYSSGLMSKATYDKTVQMFEYYIPLRGWDETTSDEVYGYLTDKSGPLGSPIKHARGRSSKADDPIATIALMADDTIRAANRNLMKQRFLIFAQNHPSDLVSVNRLWLQYNDATDEWEPVFADIDADDTPAEVAQKVEAFEARMEQLAASEPKKYKRGRDAVNIPFKVVMNNLAEHQVLVKRGGETYVLTINGNPRAAQALNGMTNPDVKINSASVSALVDKAQWLNREFSSFYTTRNPDFIVSNFLRDTLYSNCMTWVKEGRNYALKFHKNFGKFNPAMLMRLFQKWEKGTLDTNNPTEAMFYQFMLNGGETGYTNVKDIEGHKRTIAKELSRRSSVAKKGWYALGVAFDEMNRAVENCARFAAFVTSREMGRSIGRAVYDAKEVSVNFNKKGAGDKFAKASDQTRTGKFGSYISAYGRLFYIFWNASVQGMTNAGRAFKRNPIKASLGAASMFALGAIVSAMAQAMGGDGDDKDYYYNLPENVRRSNICFRIAGSPWITIPLPIEFRSVYGLGEMLVGVMTGKERYSGSELAYNIISQLSQLMPIDLTEGEGGWANLAPQFLKMPLEIATNRSWTGLPIYKDTPYNKDLPEWTKAYSNTNETIIAVTKKLNELTGGNDYRKGWFDGWWNNPANIEYALKSIFGGVSTTIMNLQASFNMAFNDKEFNWRNIPLANRIIKNGDERTAFRKAKNEYFNFMKEAEETKRLLNDYRKDTTDPVKYARLLSALNYSPGYGRYIVFESYNERVEDIRKAVKDGTAPANAEQLENEAIRDLVDAMHNYDNSAFGKSLARGDKNALQQAYDNDSTLRHMAGKEMAKRAGLTDEKFNKDTQAESERGIRAHNTYESIRNGFDFAEDVVLESEQKKAKDAKDSSREKWIGDIRTELNKIRTGKDATKTKGEVIGLGQGDDERIMKELREARKQVLNDLKNGSAEQAYRNLERRTISLGLRQKPKE